MSEGGVVIVDALSGSWQKDLVCTQALPHISWTIYFLSPSLFFFFFFNNFYGVPVVVQWLTNPTRNHGVAGLVPALAQWVDDPALL